MNLDDLSKMMSLVGKGFMMNDIISLLSKDNYRLNDEDKRTHNSALKCIYYIENGFEFINLEKTIDDLSESLEMLNIAFKIITKYKLSSNIEEFNRLISTYKEQLMNISESNIIKTNDVKEVNQFFKYIREYLLEECQKFR